MIDINNRYMNSETNIFCSDSKSFLSVLALIYSKHANVQVQLYKSEYC